MRRHPVLSILAAFVALVALAPVAHASWPTDPQANVLVGPVGQISQPDGIVADGAGGAFIAMEVGPGGNQDVYLQHVTATGGNAPGWPAGGIVVCNATGAQFMTTVMLDGAGGAFVAWRDERLGPSNADIFVQRITSAGTVSPGWPANGRNVSASFETKYEYDPHLASDGAGGCFIAWTLVFNTGTDDDIYAARVDGSGNVLWSFGEDVAGNLQDGPTICADNSGGAWVSYQSQQGATGVDIKVLHIASNGVASAYTASNASADQFVPQIATDGAGGCFVVWQDESFGNDDIFLQHFTAAGAVAPGFNPNGNPVCIDASSQTNPMIAPDGNGGTYVVWTDSRYDVSDVFAVHLTSGGSAAPGWPFGGQDVSRVDFAQFNPVVVGDGTGGALIAWTDLRSGVSSFNDVYAVRIASNGFLAPGWSNAGNVISDAAFVQTRPLIVTDGASGAICSWVDYRNGAAAYGAYAQRVDRFGALSDASPALAGIKDVSSDQGGQVRITWNASYLDVDPLDGIVNYWVWRQAPIASAQAAVRNGARWMDDALAQSSLKMSGDEQAALASHGLYMRDADAAAQYAWEFIASQPASQLPTYSYVASTTSDSTGGHNPYTPFMVQARALGSSAFWQSAPDSGYSVDNLPPNTPAPFTGTYSAGSTSLDWGANHESDFASYRLYRGSSPGFVPGPSNFVVEKSSTGFVDSPGGPYFYKLAAVDLHGNVSPYAFLQPSGTLATDDALPSVLALAPASPNPAREASTLRYDLPRAARVTLALYDAAGRRVRTLVDATLPPGRHSALWDGRTDSGAPSPSGLYFVALTSEGRTLRQRLAIVR